MSVPAIQFYDAHPGTADLRREVLQGLAATPRAISPKFFYDRRGSELFDAICELPEYWFDFHAGESIHTESSYKYTVDGFGELAALSGFRQQIVWTDDAELFSVQLLQVVSGTSAIQCGE